MEFKNSKSSRPLTSLGGWNEEHTYDGVIQTKSTPAQAFRWLSTNHNINYQDGRFYPTKECPLELPKWRDEFKPFYASGLGKGVEEIADDKVELGKLIKDIDARCKSAGCRQGDWSYGARFVKFHLLLTIADGANYRNPIEPRWKGQTEVQMSVSGRGKAGAIFSRISKYSASHQYKMGGKAHQGKGQAVRFS